MKLFNERSIILSEKVLDLSFRRHGILTSNAANSETPGFRAKELDFAKELERAWKVGSPNLSLTNNLRLTNTRHLNTDFNPASNAKLVYDNSGAVGADGNNVDLDINLGKISTNASQYTGAITLLGMKLKMLKNAVTNKG
ncbi:MAG: flagellar basal body rod protein FlgB [Deltaproteobacteria bacterium]|jgi:flagellar basal-body rod protein FlgB|nr:flagellar basal body rod protein FlgB [Deltaproteobacteria bacterium]